MPRNNLSTLRNREKKCKSEFCVFRFKLYFTYTIKKIYYSIGDKNKKESNVSKIILIIHLKNTQKNRLIKKKILARKLIIFIFFF